MRVGACPSVGLLVREYLVAALPPWGLFKSAWYFFCMFLCRPGPRSCGLWLSPCENERNSAYCEIGPFESGPALCLFPGHVRTDLP